MPRNHFMELFRYLSHKNVNHFLSYNLSVICRLQQKLLDYVDWNSFKFIEILKHLPATGIQTTWLPVL